MLSFHTDIIQNHFVITDNNQHILIDTGCPFNISEENQDRIPRGRMILQDIRRNVAPNIVEVRGMEYFAKHKILLDFSNAQVIVADENESLPIFPIAEYTLLENHDPRFPPNAAGLDRILFTMNINGTNRNMIFDTGASITDYISRAIAITGPVFDTINDFHPNLGGSYNVERHALSVLIGNENFNIAFGIQPAEVDTDVRRYGADGVIGIGLYKKYKVLIDLLGRRLTFGR